MAKRRFYDQDREMIVNVSTTLNRIWASLRPGMKTNWTSAQQAELSYIVDQVQTLIAVVSHLNEIVQNDGE